MTVVENVVSNNTQNYTAQCKVVVYPWRYQLDDPTISDEKLSQAGRLDISSQIVNVSFSKNLGEPAGSFSIELSDSPGIGSEDWKDIIKRGYWLVIYMSQDGDLTCRTKVAPPKNSRKERKRIRGICYVKRAGMKATIGDKGEINQNFVISGVDFGVVYEDTSIWHNLFKYDAIMTESLRLTGLNVIGNVRIHTAMDKIHDLFYFPANLPGAQLNNEKSLLDIGLQWLLPKEMLLDVGFSLNALSKGTYWGSLPGIKNFSETTAGIAIDHPTDFLSGNAWSQLKKLSTPQLHELFCETTFTGKPQLTFRPIPWAIDKSKYPVAGEKITYYKDVPFITVKSVDLGDCDLSEDDHSRYNSFLATVSTSMISIENNISLLQGSRFPFHNRASVRRHGFRPMHTTVDSIVKNEELGNGTADRRALLEFNEVLYDYWNNAVFAESGTITKMGSNDVKIGIALIFDKDVPYMKGKRYYIEGYTDSFSVNEKGIGEWVQEVSLTRGFETADLKNKKGFGNRNVAFSNPGEFTPNGSSGSDE